MEIFGAGNFVGWWPLVTWDGSNHEEILDWIRGQDPADPPAADAWQIAAVDSAALTLTRPASHPHGYDHRLDVRANVGDWLGANVFINSEALTVQRVDPAGKWKTADRYGRPAQAGDTAAPAT